jgi:hypothetical protein
MAVCGELVNCGVKARSTTAPDSVVFVVRTAGLCQPNTIAKTALAGVPVLLDPSRRRDMQNRFCAPVLAGL